jgi:drug/metabolite transporter (DMT)-like permease
LFAVAATLVTWGSSYVAIRHAVRGFPPGALALFRFSIASVTLALLTIPTKKVSLRRMPARDLFGFFWIGLFAISIYHTALNAGERTVSAGAASLLINTGPIWTALIAMFLLGERLGVRGWLGTALAFGGAMLVSAGAAGGIRFSPGVALIFVSSLCQAIWFVTQKPYLKRYGALESTCLVIWFGVVWLLPFLPQLVGALHHVSRTELWSAIYLGVVPGAFGYISWTYVLSRLPASRAASLLYLVSPLAYLIAWVVLGEKPDVTAFLGGIPIIAGLAMVNAGRRAEGGGRAESKSR